MIKWLSAHRWVNLWIVCIYFPIVVLPHKRFGAFLNDVVFRGITRDQYNSYVLLCFSALLLIFGAYMIAQAVKNQVVKPLLIGLIVNVIIASIIIKYLFVINIEMVHFPQYAVLTLLLFPLLKNFNQVLIVGTVLGIIDEAYQYFYLAPKDTTYYDFNDIATDIVGVVFGLLILKAMGIKTERTYAWKNSPALWAIGGVAILILVAHVMGALSIYPSDNHQYHLLRTWPTDFWSRVFPNKPQPIFHFMRPLEGTVLCTILLYFWSRYFDGFRRYTHYSH